MNNNLDHFSSSKQKELAHIVAVLRDEFEQVTGFANGKKKHSRILKIILFGSQYILSGPRFALKPNFFLLNRFLQEI